MTNVTTLVMITPLHEVAKNLIRSYALRPDVQIATFLDWCCIRKDLPLVRSTLDPLCHSRVGSFNYVISALWGRAAPSRLIHRALHPSTFISSSVSRVRSKTCSCGKSPCQEETVASSHMRDAIVSQFRAENVTDVNKR